MASMRERVAAGVDLLDSHFGGRQAWVQHIDATDLDMQICEQCIVGQLSEEMYNDALDAMGITPPNAAQYGFDILPVDSEEGRSDVYQAYDELRQVWLDYIEEWT